MSNWEEKARQADEYLKQRREEAEQQLKQRLRRAEQIQEQRRLDLDRDTLRMFADKVGGINIYDKFKRLRNEVWKEGTVSIVSEETRYEGREGDRPVTYRVYGISLSCSSRGLCVKEAKSIPQYNVNYPKKIHDYSLTQTLSAYLQVGQNRIVIMDTAICGDISWWNLKSCSDLSDIRDHGFYCEHASWNHVLQSLPRELREISIGASDLEVLFDMALAKSCQYRTENRLLPRMIEEDREQLLRRERGFWRRWFS